MIYRVYFFNQYDQFAVQFLVRSNIADAKGSGNMCSLVIAAIAFRAVLATRNCFEVSRVGKLSNDPCNKVIYHWSMRRATSSTKKMAASSSAGKSYDRTYETQIPFTNKRTLSALSGFNREISVTATRATESSIFFQRGN